jgi:hypothetical protein
VKCIHGLDARFCAPCNANGKTPLAPSETKRKNLPSQTSSLIDSRVGEDARTLILTADVVRGWRPLQKVCGFCEEVRVASFAESDVRIQVKVLPKWGSLISRPPKMRDTSGPSRRRGFVKRSPQAGAQMPTRPVPLIEEGPVRYTVTGGQLRITVELVGPNGMFNSKLAWHSSSSGLPAGQWVDDKLKATWKDERDGELDAVFAGDLQLQVLIVVHPGSPKKTVEREWLERHFVSGGLPSLGKRR